MSVLWGDGLGVCRSALASLSFLSFKLHQVCRDIKANVSNTPCLLAHQLDPWYLSVVLSNDPDLRNNKFTSAAAVVYMPITQSYDCVLPFTCAVIDGRSFNAVHVVACLLFRSQIIIISKCCTRCCNKHLRVISAPALSCFAPRRYWILRTCTLVCNGWLDSW